MRWPGSFFFTKMNMGPRIFTVTEANALVPRLEEAFTAFDGIRSRLRRLKSKMDVLEMLWGEEIQSDSNPDRREYTHYASDVDKAKNEFEAVTRQLGAQEIMLKSVENGLIDFYGVVEGRLVFLCWKRGEKCVEFYHHLEDGFDGRRTIAAERKAD